MNDPLAPVFGAIASAAAMALGLASLCRWVQLDLPGVLDDVGAQVDRLAERLDALELQVAAPAIARPSPSR